MPKRNPSTGSYIDPKDIVATGEPINLSAVALCVPKMLQSMDKSMVKLAQVKPDWSLYKITIKYGAPFVVREMCDRCGKVWIPPRWRKIRRYTDKELGPIYLEAGVCKDCINAAVYVDSFLDGDPLSEIQAKKLFYEYAVEYERNWRMVLANAPNIIMKEDEWIHRCTFFNGCAFCGAPIQVRAKFFPTRLNGTHSPWNVIPLCADCNALHSYGRKDATKQINRYKIFSTHEYFNKTKTTRMYLLQQMREHNVYMDPLIPFMERFRETKTLEGSE